MAEAEPKGSAWKSMAVKMEGEAAWGYGTVAAAMPLNRPIPCRERFRTSLRRGPSSLFRLCESLLLIDSRLIGGLEGRLHALLGLAAEAAGSCDQIVYKLHLNKCSSVDLKHSGLINCHHINIVRWCCDFKR